MNLAHSCKRVAELLSQRLDEPLGRFNQVRMRIHLSMCDNCRNVEQQMLGMEALTRDLFGANAPLGDDAMAAGTGAESPARPGTWAPRSQSAP